MCLTKGEHCSKATTLFDAIDEKLLEKDVSWKNCISIGLDNTNSVKSRVLKKNPHCFIAVATVTLLILQLEKVVLLMPLLVGLMLKITRLIFIIT